MPSSLDAKPLAALRKGTALTADAFGDAAQPAPFSISLKGFGAAFDRAFALARRSPRQKM